MQATLPPVTGTGATAAVDAAVANVSRLGRVADLAADSLERIAKIVFEQAFPKAEGSERREAGTTPVVAQAGGHGAARGHGSGDVTNRGNR